MALVVEDGSGLSTAESYVSVADCGTYATKLGLTFDPTLVTACEQALRRATVWIDAAYGARFKSARTVPATQALEWPRYDVWHEGRQEYIGSDEIPTELVRATCEAAIREYAKPGCLMADTHPSGIVRRYQAGSVSVEYERAASGASLYPKIDAFLAPLVRGSSIVGRAVRG